MFVRERDKFLAYATAADLIRFVIRRAPTCHSADAD
jgi:hypothetical protein